MPAGVRAAFPALELPRVRDDIEELPVRVLQNLLLEEGDAAIEECGWRYRRSSSPWSLRL
jgi:hypothetical protein